MGVDVTRNRRRLHFAVALSAAQVLVRERIIRSPLAMSPIFFVPQHVANRALHDCRPRQMACAARSEQKWLQTGESPGCHVECHVFPGFRSQDLHSAEHPYHACAIRPCFFIFTHDICRALSATRGPTPKAHGQRGSRSPMLAKRETRRRPSMPADTVQRLRLKDSMVQNAVTSAR